MIPSQTALNLVAHDPTVQEILLGSCFKTRTVKSGAEEQKKATLAFTRCPQAVHKIIDYLNVNNINKW